nr:immunoglobulin heavy chain junction region [Macaca mulatta]MOV43352.1 immunoglobulin heavy chain junction region [Macaca mulatta]
CARDLYSSAWFRHFDYW